MTYDILKFCISHLSKILPNLLSEECEVVDEIFILTDEVSTQFGILCSDTERTSIEITLTHHHTSENDERQCTESEFLSTEQSHENDVTTSLQLTVHLHSHLTSQSVLHQRLLSLRQTNLR